MALNNPFVFDAATSLSCSDIIDIYEDFNYSELLMTNKNLFLTGERGAGKTMTLLYHSLPIQYHKHNALPLSKILNIYMPSIFLTTNNSDMQFFPEDKAYVINEHFLSASILFHVFKSLSEIPNIFPRDSEIDFIKNINDTCNLAIQFKDGIAMSIKRHAQRESTRWQMALSQIALNEKAAFDFDRPLLFMGHVLPILDELLNLHSLSGYHFSIMIDDGQFLNSFQARLINTWISLRDHSKYSFKVATINLEHPTYHTRDGNCLNEGHDYTMIDMEMPYQNADSDFAHLANNIINKRLKRYLSIDNPDAIKFFPINKELERDLEGARNRAFEDIQRKSPNATEKAISDYIYKYHRAIYFRERSSKANRPAYSGLEIITQLSTGVVRNFLEPCCYMYNEVKTKQGSDAIVECIPAAIQTKSILDYSKRKWQMLHEGIHKFDSTCSEDDSRKIYSLIDNLCVFFKARLLSDISEPRAVMFSISDRNFDKFDEILKLINIARRAQYIYVRLGNAKDDGKSEYYYVINKMLLPNRGLDPVGQHARVSIKARVLYEAAISNKKINSSSIEDDSNNGKLF